MAPQHSKEQKSRVFDLTWQLTQYASHHDNPVNIGIHLTCIPVILWSALIFAAKTGPLLTAPASSAALQSLFRTFTPNLGMLLMVSYVLYYIKLDKVAGVIAAPFFIGAAKHATKFLATNPNATKIAYAAQVIAWGLQFVGHGVYEKRAPKLLDNLLQAFVLGPYFVLYEVLFWVGYRPQLRADLKKAVAEDIREFKAKKALEAAQKKK